MKKIYAILMLAIFNGNSIASEFIHKTGNTTRKFIHTESLNDGAKVYMATVTMKNSPGSSIDKYIVNCEMSRVWLYYGPTTGGLTDLPGGGGGEITNKAELQPIIMSACSENNNKR